MGAPELGWLHQSGRSKSRYLALAGSLAVVGAHNEQPTWDYYEDIDFQVQVIDLGDGTRRFDRDDRVARAVVDGVVVMSPPGSGELEAVDLTTGASLWTARLPGEKFKPVEGAIYSWKDRTLYVATWPDSHQAPGPPKKSHQYFISDVRQRAGLVMLASWRRDPQVEVFYQVLRGQELIWNWSAQADNSDVLLDEHGWVLRTSRALEGYSSEGQRLWEG
ncbi:MAG: hypothetical protein KC910_08285, partial [Candidatus Eremiobacteraeota bacterium]|nr:hypothetical protein [Candidatus Eremiobacteraeota bacterium]